VERLEVDSIYFDQSYYIVPEDKVGQEAFAVIREAMSERKVAGIARVVLGGRERLILLEPRHKGILGTILHPNYEARGDGAYFADIPDIKISHEMLDLAGHIIDTKKGAFDPETFTDRYQGAMLELIRAKQAGKPVRAPHAAPPANVINLVDALKRSLGAEARNPPRSESRRAPSRGAARRAERQAGTAKSGRPSRAKKAS